MDRRPENLRSITHDMRNLLTAVRGHAELALRALSAEDAAREDVAHVLVVTAAVFELIDQIDGNDSSDSLVATNLDGTVASMHRLIESLMPTGIGIEVAPDASAARVSVPKLRIERIVLNLAINARDAMGDTGELKVTTTASDEEASIIVGDSGPGFSEDAQAHLFESGFTTKSDRGGSGHGLFALKGIVDSAGGSISVDSRPGQGATLTVRLPLAVDQPEAGDGGGAGTPGELDPTESAGAEAAAEPVASAKVAPVHGVNGPVVAAPKTGATDTSKPQSSVATSEATEAARVSAASGRAGPGRPQPIHPSLTSGP